MPGMPGADTHRRNSSDSDNPGSGSSGSETPNTTAPENGSTSRRGVDRPMVVPGGGANGEDVVVWPDGRIVTLPGKVPTTTAPTAAGQ